jgi:transcriptional regulator with XRE-family HTH domain
MTIHDFHVTVRIRNNQLIERREQLGLNAKQFAEKAGVGYARYLLLETMRLSPVSTKGGWLPMVQTIAAFWGESPEILWPGSIRKMREVVAVKRMSEELVLGEHTYHLALPPDEVLEERHQAEHLNLLVNTLFNRREKYILNNVDETHKTLGKRFGVSPERIRQIYSRCLTKLRGKIKTPLPNDLSRGKE